MCVHAKRSLQFLPSPRPPWITAIRVNGDPFIQRYSVYCTCLCLCVCVIVSNVVRA